MVGFGFALKCESCKPLELLCMNILLHHYSFFLPSVQVFLGYTKSSCGNDMVKKDYLLDLIRLCTVGDLLRLVLEVIL